MTSRTLLGRDQALIKSKKKKRSKKDSKDFRVLIQGLKAARGEVRRKGVSKISHLQQQLIVQENP